MTSFNPAHDYHHYLYGCGNGYGDICGKGSGTGIVYWDNSFLPFINHCHAYGCGKGIGEGDPRGTGYGFEKCIDDGES